ncbi:MAG: hypothetical protein KAR42_15220 [candidate division Zixibacteria bacterium]|nr:hypothetical protein [candidate division Zixibacteria bacterium]
METIPSALGSLATWNQFILHNDSKVPVNPSTLEKIDPHLPTSWMNADTALFLGKQLNLGVGFVFTENDPFFFFDIDNCYNGNGWSDLANNICAQFSGCAMEVSRSGTGLHILGTGNPEHVRCKNIPLNLEFYTSKRYVALTGTGITGDISYQPVGLQDLVNAYFTGDVAQDADWTDGPVEEWNGPEDDDKLIKKALKSKSGGSMFGGRASFKELWTAEGDKLGEVYPDQGGLRAFDSSSADAALTQHLAFWTGKDCERIDRLFRQSKLMREKWDTREDYRTRTILHAVGHCKKVYGTKRKSVAPVEPMVDTGDNIRMGFQYLAVEEQIALFKGCVYIRDVHRVFTPDGSLLRPEQFKAAYGGYTLALDSVNGKTTRNAWDAFTESMAYHFPKAHSGCFRPECPPGALIKEEDRALVNTYIPITTPRKQGDATPFLQHLAKVLPVPRDQQILLSYMAACVQYPGTKFQWSPLLQGCEGNGKTLFINCMTEAMGYRYTHLPNASELAKSGGKFNAWLDNKLFIGVEEIYVGDRREVSDALKPLITNSRIEIQGKGDNQVMGDNRANFFMCSQHKDAVLKTRRDRRYCVFFTAQQNEDDMIQAGWITPTFTPTNYFPKLYDWLRAEGYAIVNDYLRSYKIADELNPATSCHRAPVTSSTNEAIYVSMGRVEQEILAAIEEGRPGFCGGWISSMMLNKFLEERRDNKRVPRNRRRELLKNLGYIQHPGLRNGRVNVTIPFEGGKPRLYVLAGHLVANITDGVMIVQKYKEAQGYILESEGLTSTAGNGTL